MTMNMEKINYEKREDLLKRIQEGLEDSMCIREYYEGDEYESLVDESVEDALIEKYGLEDIEIMKLVSKLSDTIFSTFPTG